MEKVKSYIPLIVFLFVPYGFLSFGIIHQGHHFALIIGALLILSSMIRNNVLFVFGVFLGLWQIFLFLYIMTNPGIPQVIPASGMGTVLFVIMGFSVYLVFSKLNIKKNNIFNFICIAVILQSILSIFQKMGIDPIVMALKLFVPAQHRLTTGTITGTLGNPNFLSAFVAISMPFFFRKKWFWFIPLLIWVLITGRTSAATMPVVIGIGIFLWICLNDYVKAETAKNKSKKKHLTKNSFLDILITGNKFVKLTIISVGIALIAGYYSFDNSNLFQSDRFEYWKFIFNQVTSYLPTTIFGMGPGAFWKNNFPLHSEWVSCFHQFGIVGICLLIAYIYTVINKLKHRLLLVSFIIIVLNIVGNSALHYAPTAFLICMIGGLIEREKICQNTKPLKVSIKQ